jgi:apolipoprotein N-acyltransferase
MTAFSGTSQALTITAWFGLLPLFLAVRILNPREALIAGGFWGACLFAALVALGQSFAVSAPLSLLLLATIPALYTCLGARLTRWTGFHPLLLGLGWVGVELALEPLGLRDGLLAGTQGDGFVFQALGSTLGYGFIAFLIALVNALLLSVLHELPMQGALLFSGPDQSPEPLLTRDGLEWSSPFFLRCVQPRAPPLPQTEQPNRGPASLPCKR